MKAHATRISLNRDGSTWSRPSAGYLESSVEIELDEFLEIGRLTVELPENDERWPKGAPLEDTFVVENKVMRRRSVA